MVTRFSQVPRSVAHLDPSKLGEQPVALPRSFYERDVLVVARECIGALLVATHGDQPLVGRIVETEAYRGPEDAAAHSYRGRRTRRTEVMFGPAGHAYVFMIYGLHYNFNLVTGQPGEPQAVLIRAVEPLLGSDHMANRRGLDDSDSVSLTNGPGKLCQAFGITLSHYGIDLTQRSLFLAAGPRASVSTSPRIGVDYAKEWAAKPWRFFETGNRYVSRAR